jgi:hypothetical protein
MNALEQTKCYLMQYVRSQKTSPWLARMKQKIGPDGLCNTWVVWPEIGTQIVLTVITIIHNKNKNEQTI